MNLIELFPEEDYRFHFRFERGEPADFFRSTSENAKLIAERKHWLETAPARCLALLAEGVPLLNETLGFATHCSSRRKETVILDVEGNDLTLPPPTQTMQSSSPLPSPPEEERENCRPPAVAPSASGFGVPSLLTSIATMRALGCWWEPDFLLLKVEPAGAVRMVGGCVCFPSSWSLEEKIGHPIEMIHGVVPGLNSAVGNQIHGFLSKLRPGIAWLRSNWGLTRSPELNQHPSRNLPRLDDRVQLEEVWLRVEHQALIALPKSHGVLFGIRLAVHPLGEIRFDPQLALRLVRALQTMPEPMALYKGIAPAKARLIKLLQE